MQPGEMGRSVYLIAHQHFETWISADSEPSLMRTNTSSLVNKQLNEIGSLISIIVLF